MPSACNELLKCGCKTRKCTSRCTCSRNRIHCLYACGYKAECSNQHNLASDLDDTDDDDEGDGINDKCFICKHKLNNTIFLIIQFILTLILDNHVNDEVLLSLYVL